MSIQQLPYEVLENILRTVHKNSLWKDEMIKCATVCRAWHLPACRVLFARLNITNMNQFLKNLTHQHSNQGVHCKVLYIGKNCGEPEYPSEEYKQLFSYLPNLQTIILENSYLRIFHLRHISQHAKLIKHVKQILFEGDWRSGESQPYYQCAIAFKNSMRQIEIDSPGESITSTNGRVGNIITFLSDFTVLTTLQIKNLENSRAINIPELSMFGIMRSCPNLISFSFYNSFQEHENDNINHNINHSKLKYLDITMPKITEYHTRYLVKNITELNEFKLKCRSLEPRLWMEKIGPNKLDCFQGYLARIEKVDLEIEGKLVTQTTQYLPFVTKIIVNEHSKPINICLSIGKYDTSNSPETKIRKRNDSIYFDFQIDIKKFLSLTKPTLSPKLLQEAIAPPALKKMKIQTFNLVFKSKHKNIKYEVPLRIIKTVMGGFESLKDFSLNMDVFSYSSIQIIIGSKEISGYDYRCMDHWYLRALQRRYSSVSDKLAYALIKGVNSTEDIKSTVKLLPHVQYLKLHDCRFILDKSSNISFDLDILQLRLLEINASLLVRESLDNKTIVLEVEEKRSNKTLCYKWKKQKRKTEDIVFKPVESTYARTYGRLLSPNFSTISIKCYSLEKLAICFNYEYTNEFFSTVVNLERNT